MADCKIFNLGKNTAFSFYNLLIHFHFNKLKSCCMISVAFLKLKNCLLLVLKLCIFHKRSVMLSCLLCRTIMMKSDKHSSRN